jgi:Undecaprenyl-phosphate glucose phosphotransferase
LSLNAHTLPLAATIIEFVLIAAVTFEASALYHRVMFGREPSVIFYLLSTACLAALFVVRSGFARDYSLKRLLDPRELLRSVLVRWNSAYCLFVFALFMVQATDFYSRGAILVQYGVGLATATVLRLLLAQLVTYGLESGWLEGKKVAIVGEADMATDTVRRLCLERQGVDIVGLVMLASPGRAREAATLIAEDTRAALQAVQNIARHTAVDDILINLPWTDGKRIRTFVEGLAAVPATIHLAPDQSCDWSGSPVLARVGRTHTIRLSRAPLTLKDRILKRAFDITASTLLLVLTGPLLIVIALAIKLDTPGPVLFLQRRHGFSHREFRVLKFRTMRTLEDGAVIRQATRNDGRVTRIGRLLRSANLDELPQLFNVLAGSMSLVGPRPHAIAHNNEYAEKIRLYARRHNVKPGITGWAQVNGYRGETDSIDKMRRRLEHDLYYIDHWSLMLDIKILIMTVLSPRSYRNAY